MKNDASFPQEITRISQTWRRQNQSACPACCAFLSRRARLPWHAQKMCAVTIVGTVLNARLFLLAILSAISLSDAEVSGLELTVADPGVGPGRPGPPYFSTKMKPEGPQKILLETGPPLISGSG